MPWPGRLLIANRWIVVGGRQSRRVTLMSLNFALLDMSRPEVASLVAAMLQARDSVARRSWSHPQEPTSEEWWGDVLADPRARKGEQRASDLPLRRAFYTLAETILVACSKCEWKAAFRRDELIASHGRDYPMSNLLDELAAAGLSAAWLLLGSLRGALRAVRGDPLRGMVALREVKSVQKMKGRQRGHLNTAVHNHAG